MTARIRVLLVVVMTVVLGSIVGIPPARAQTTPLDALRKGTASEIQTGPSTGPSVRVFGLADDQMYVAMLAHQSNLLRLLIKYEEERSDKQIGAGSSASGTTTLVSKGTVPRILGFAAENGALERSQSGTTVTFRGNLGGALRALAGQGLFHLATGDDPALNGLSHVSLSASFDTSRGTDASGNTFTADRQQLSEWSARWQIVNNRDPQGLAALTRWQSDVRSAQEKLADANLLLNRRLGEDVAVTRWIADTAAHVAAAKAAAAAASKNTDEAAADITDVLKAQESKFPATQLGPDIVVALENWDRAASAFVTARHNLLDDLKAGALVTFEYTSDRPLKAPKTSNLKLVGEVGGSVDLTGNASLTLFNGGIPLGASGRIRDFQLSGEMDIKFGSADTVGAFVLAFSGKYVRQLEDSYSDAGIVIPDTKGTIALGQVKLIVPVKGSAAKIPLSITFANRTELIKESIVRANVGVTYDLDLIFAKFRP